MKDKIVLITGCSSGIGLESALQFAKKGAIVYATMRDLSKNKNLVERAKDEKVQIKLLPLDVTDENSLQSAVKQIVKKQGRIDILVNNAGYGLYGPMCELDMKDIRAQYETNVFGLIRCMQLCVPHMRAGAKILNISSVVGHMGIPMMGAYCSSKFAVEGITEAVRRELWSKGIQVTAIEPGGTQTEFGTGSLKIGGNAKSPLHKKGMRLRTKMLGKKSGDTARFVAWDIVRIANKRSLGVRYGVGLQGRGIRLMQRLLPDVVIDTIFKVLLWIS